MIRTVCKVCKRILDVGEEDICWECEAKKKKEK